MIWSSQKQVVYVSNVPDVWVVCSFVRSFDCFTLDTFPNLFLSLFKGEIFLPQEALATQVPLVLVLALDMDFLLVTLGGSNVCPEGATKPGSFKLVTPCLANY